MKKIFTLISIAIITMAFGFVQNANASITINVKADAAPYLFTWDASDQPLNGEWPGTQMSETISFNNETYYTASFETSLLNIIFNNGNGTQTSDIKGLTDGTYYFTYDGGTGYQDITSEVTGVVTEYTYTVAGVESVFGSNWNAVDTNNDMVKQDDGTYKWEKTDITLPAGNITFKVVRDHSWDNSWPAQNYELAIEESGIYTITITFDPSTSNVGATATKTGEAQVETVYRVAGSSTELFGSSWNGSDDNNKMTEESEGYWTKSYSNVYLSAGDIEFKVVKNGSEWLPSENVVMTIGEAGNYNVTIFYSEEDQEVNYKDLELVSLETPDLYIIGQVNDNEWDPTVGVKMEYSDGIYKAADITIKGASEGYSYFHFTRKLGEANDETGWNTVNAAKVGAVSNGDFLVTDELLGQEIQLMAGGNAFKVAAGVYAITVSLDNMVAVITKTGDGIANSIQTVTVDTKSLDIYDLSGRQLTNSKLNKGIYIKNGRKFVVK